MKKLSVLLCLPLLAAPALAVEHGAEIVDRSWEKAMLAGDVDAVVALYTEDAVLYPPDAMVIEGQDAIRSSWEAFLNAFRVESVALDARYQTEGDTSWSWGTWTITLIPNDGGQPMTMQGRATAVAKKLGSEWKYFVDHASVPLQAPGAAPQAGGQAPQH